MSRHGQELTGRSFGNLTVVGSAGKRNGNKRWLCRCKCGRELAVWQPNLLSGRSRSCGCEAPMPGDRHYIDGTCVEMITSKTISRSNTSGVRGVYWNPRRGKWAAQITFRGRTYYLGLYARLEDAAAARARAEEKYFGGFLREKGMLCLPDPPAGGGGTPGGERALG